MKRVFVPGVFDVFHVGHLNYLKSAAEAGDHLIVGVQDDRFVLKCKGINPIIPLADRIAVLEALQCVDEVVSYTNVFQGPLLEGLEIDVFAAGEEYGQNEEYPDQKRTLEYCQANDVEVFQIPRTNHVSSTNVRGHLKQFWNARARLQDELTGGVTVLGSFQGDQKKVGKETQIEVETILQATGDPPRAKACSTWAVATVANWISSVRVSDESSGSILLQVCWKSQSNASRRPKIRSNWWKPMCRNT
ncbi:MAG: adenylyltransferase/cytidyltransferase family protein [Planctomycetes bacterium]|nr:adenylyltransferase/cytidyltransferase family protein [Planctomycetota bacterium]